VAGKVGSKVDMVQKMCTHVCKCKYDTIDLGYSTQQNYHSK
jgi:hypothetical protein